MYKKLWSLFEVQQGKAASTVYCFRNLQDGDWGVPIGDWEEPREWHPPVKTGKQGPPKKVYEQVPHTFCDKVINTSKNIKSYIPRKDTSGNTYYSTIAFPAIYFTRDKSHGPDGGRINKYSSKGSTAYKEVIGIGPVI